MIYALVGRRIDPPDAPAARFPLRNIPLVRERLSALFQQASPGTLICSAACGADLLALDAAGGLGWRRRIFLPFDRHQFRSSSVTDRPGDWGPLYDRIIDAVDAAGGLVTASEPPGDAAFAAVNDRLLEDAAALAAATAERQAAVLVWEGQGRGSGDMTAIFAEAARKRGIEVLEISTMD